MIQYPNQRPAHWVQWRFMPEGDTVTWSWIQPNGLLAGQIECSYKFSGYGVHFVWGPKYEPVEYIDQCAHVIAMRIHSEELKRNAEKARRQALWDLVDAHGMRDELEALIDEYY